MMDSKAIGRTTEANAIEVIKIIEGTLMLAEIADYAAQIVPETRISDKTGMIPMINANLLKNDLYLHPYRL